MEALLSRFLQEEELLFLLKPYEQLRYLINGKNQDKLIQSFLKINLFFNSKLPSESLRCVLEFNYKISTKKTNQILEYFTHQKPSSSQQNFPHLLHCLTLHQIVTLKKIAFKIKTRRRLLKNYLHLKDSLVDQNVREKFLQSRVALMISADQASIKPSVEVEAKLANRTVVVTSDRGVLLKLNLNATSVQSEDDLTLRLVR